MGQQLQSGLTFAKAGLLLQKPRYFPKNGLTFAKNDYAAQTVSPGCDQAGECPACWLEDGCLWTRAACSNRNTDDVSSDDKLDAAILLPPGCRIV